jgi:hypothetical protein
MAITRGQVSTLGVVGSGTTASTSWGTNPVAGSKVLVAVQINDVSSVLTVTDNGATPRTFTLDATANGNGSITPVYIYRADNITLPGAGSYAVTVSTSGVAHGIQAGGVEYKGVKAGGPTATNSNNVTTGNVSVTTNNVTPSAAGALYFSTFFDNTGLNPETITLTGSGFIEQFTQVNGASNWAGGVADKIDAGGPTSTGCSWTIGDSTTWNAAIVVYDAATPGMFPKSILANQAVMRSAVW